MFEEAAIARKDSITTPTAKSEHPPGSERKSSFSPLVGFVVTIFN